MARSAFRAGSQGQRLVTSGGEDPARLCSWTLSTVWRGLESLLDYAAADGMKHLVAAGGVMSNAICAVR